MSALMPMSYDKSSFIPSVTRIITKRTAATAVFRHSHNICFTYGTPHIVPPYDASVQCLLCCVVQVPLGFFKHSHIQVIGSSLPDRIWCNGQHCRLSRGSSGFDSPYPNYVFVLLGSIHHPSSLNLNLFFASDITVPEELRIRSRGIWKTQVILRLTMFHQGMCGSNICIAI